MTSKLTPVTADLVATKGMASPVSSAVVHLREDLPASDPPPGKTKKGSAPEPVANLNFKVAKSLKKAFDQAALDEDMSNKDFLAHVFKFYKQHHKAP